MTTKVPADALCKEWRGFVIPISCGNNKQGILLRGRVHLLLSKGNYCYRKENWRERKHKSIHRSTVNANQSVLNLLLTAAASPILGLNA